jgi:hypothetical protein
MLPARGTEEERLMRQVLLVVVLALAATISFAGSPESCDLHGTWIGEVDPAAGGGKFFVTYHGRTRTEGTTELQFLDIPADLDGLFPLAERYSATKGVWKRTGRRTFVYTLVTYAVDANNTTYYSVENNGTLTVSEDCQSGVVEAYIEYILPDGTPFFCTPGGATQTRLNIEEPCTPVE